MAKRRFRIVRIEERNDHCVSGSRDDLLLNDMHRTQHHHCRASHVISIRAMVYSPGSDTRGADSMRGRGQQPHSSANRDPGELWRTPPGPARMVAGTVSDD